MTRRLMSVVTASLCLGVGVTTALTAGALATPIERPPSSPGPRAVTDGRIAFVDDASGALETVNPDGTALTQVTDPSHQGFVISPPTWTPDGRWLIYSAFVGQGDVRLYEIRPDGTHAQRLTHDAPGYNEFVPAVTPNGREVIFLRCRPDPPGGCGLFAVRRDGTDRHVVVPFGSPRKDAGPGLFGISPDGRHLAYGEFGLRGITEQVWVSRIDGSHAHPIGKPADEFTSLSWTRDGRQLVVNGPNNHLNNGLYLLPVRGGRPTLIYKPPFPFNAAYGVVSPSGTRVAYISDQDFPDLSGRHLYEIGLHGANRRRVDVGTDVVGVPAWGTAPLLPASASTPLSERAPSLTPRVRHHLMSLVPAYLRTELVRPAERP